jgi:hypothetical protein
VFGGTEHQRTRVPTAAPATRAAGRDESHQPEWSWRQPDNGVSASFFYSRAGVRPALRVVADPDERPADVRTTKPMPAVFCGHGSPMNALEANRYTAAWRTFGETIPRPRAIVSCWTRTTGRILASEALGASQASVCRVPTRSMTWIVTPQPIVGSNAVALLDVGLLSPVMLVQLVSTRARGRLRMGSVLQSRVDRALLRFHWRQSGRLTAEETNSERHEAREVPLIHDGCRVAADFRRPRS